VDAQNVNRLDLEVGVFELFGSGSIGAKSTVERELTWLTTQLRAQDASAPGKMYLFMLEISS
jgi:hypothetical protein